MSWVAAAVVGGAVVGGMATADAAGEAADAQRDAANTSSQTQLTMFNQNREDMAPWRTAGTQALQELAYQLGLSPTRGGTLPQIESSADIRRRLEAQFTRTNTDGRPMSLRERRAAGLPLFGGSSGGFGAGDSDPVIDQQNVPRNIVDEAGLAVAVQAEIARQTKARDDAAAKQRTTAGADPMFGSLNRDFKLSDFTTDPGYQFRMDEGREQRERMAAARGGLMSGGTLKELERYGQDYASGEFSNAYNRFNNDRTQRFNRLASIAGVGQMATRDVGNMGTQVAANIGENIVGAGNAQAAGAIGRGNAISDAAGSIGNWFTMRQFMNPGTGGAGTGGVPPNPWAGGAGTLGGTSGIDYSIYG